ncbi:MAG: hypothetical protein JF618_09840 [Leifsonia sp.]|nr:hypothetical protein [Leifsonia sp.]
MPVTALRRIALGAWAGLVTLALAAAPAFSASALVTASPVDHPAAATATPTPVSLAVLVPLTVRPTATGLIDSTTLAAYTAPLGVLTRQLDAVIGTRAVIGLDPMILASIRVLGTSAPASATNWLERLRTSGNEVFALAYADADLAALSRADALTLRDPVNFTFAIDPGNFGPSSTASPTPDASTGPTEPPVNPGSPPPLPTDAADVLAWSYTLTSIAWPSDDSVVTSDLADLSAAGYRSVVVSSSNVSATPSGYVDLPGIHGIVADAGVTSLVRDAVYSSDPAGPQDALDRVNSALRGMAAVSPGRTVVATLDRRWPLGALNLHALFQDLATQTSVVTVGLTSVLAGAHPAATIVDEAGDPARTAQVGSAVQAIGVESQFATVAVDPTAVTAPRRLAFLALLAVSWLRGTDDWAGQVTAFLAESQTLLGSVHIVAGSDLVVGSGATNIPVTVSNALNVPIVVLVNVDSPSSVLQVRAQNVPLTVEAGSSNKAAIPVAALTNGQVDTTITLTSAAGVAIGGPDTVSVDLHPGWESVGTAIAIALLVLIFGGGIARNIVKRRAARRAQPAEAPGD